MVGLDIFKSIKDHAESLMKHKGYVYKPIEASDANGLTVVNYEKVSTFNCRLSFKSSSYSLDDLNALSSSEMVLFTPSELSLDEGALVMVSQGGLDYYLQVSKGKAYESHREYEVKEVGKWL